MAEPGWYPDEQDPNSQHYFDGENWTGQRRPNSPAQQPWAGTAPAEASGETVRRGDLAGWDGQPQFRGQLQPYGQPQSQGQPQPYGQPPTDQQWSNPPAGSGRPWNQPQAGGWEQQSPRGGQYAAPNTPQRPPAAYGQWDPSAAAPPPKRSRRKPLLAGGIAAVLVAAGLVTWLAWPSDDPPSLTYNGKAIASASDTLTTAESAVGRAVTQRHGISNDQTRCYFARPKTPASGAKKSDVQDSLRCGPVLFVDGQKTADYLKVSLTPGTKSGKATLEAPSDVRTAEPMTLGTDVDLVRPDKKTPPDGNPLEVPKPPAADTGLLAVESLGSSGKPTTPATGVMVGRDIKVTVAGAGEISRYGTGDDARSAPSGQRLIAFGVDYGTGDVGSGGTKPQISVAGVLHPLPPTTSSGDYIVAAVPQADKPQLVLTDGGFRQTLSLPDATPGAQNLKVLTRKTRSRYIGVTKIVPVQLSKGSAKLQEKYTTTASFAFLDFWAPGNTTVHAANPSRAILTVRLNYVDPDNKKTFGYPVALERLVVGGTVIKARNIAVGKDRVLGVFDVPASFTVGTLQVSGKTGIGSGVTASIRTTTSWTVTIPAG